MRKCKKCHRQISIMEEYCSGCLKNLSLREKLIEALRREHFFKPCSTNRSFGNFVKIKTSGNKMIKDYASLRPYFAFSETYLITNIHRLSPNFEIGSLAGSNLQ
jgi:hypothetical protein